MSFDAISVLNASGNRLPLVALKITSNSLDNPICLVQSQEEKTLSDNNGNTYVFLPCSLSVNFPERNTSGFSDLNFVVGDTLGLSMGYVSQVMSNYDVAELTLLEYLPDETEPIYHLTLSVTHAEITQKSATFSAGWHDCLNLKFPYRRYTAKHFKGLRYVA
jgi:hypothetical protein